ncbi:hypothetical protein SLEP1_g12091 [Rubroshorea leprosula]|nr:hypothetical protein SLEP1_g12091 [Rubroshorea leprosula]
MDMHIHMSYCTPQGFRLLATNYLEIGYHRYFGEIEDLLKTTEVSPAQVAEELMKSDNANVALAGLIKLLKRKNLEGDETMDEDDNKYGIQKAKRQKLDKKPRKSTRVIGRRVSKKKN